MNLFAVSFFGHRQVDDPFLIERQLESIIRELLLTKEYIEFLVGRDGEFDNRHFPKEIPGAYHQRNLSQ